MLQHILICLLCQGRKELIDTKGGRAADLQGKCQQFQEIWQLNMGGAGSRRDKA